MRNRFLFLLFLLPSAVQAESAAQAVFISECRAVNTSTGLQCAIGRGGMELRWLKDQAKQTPAEHDAGNLAYAKITMRYYDMGFRHFTVRSNFWKPGAMKQCTLRNTRGIFCVEYVCDANGKNCEAQK